MTTTTTNRPIRNLAPEHTGEIPSRAHVADTTAHAIANVTGLSADSVGRMLTWAAKHCPPDYREDVRQECALALVDVRPDAEPLAFVIVKRTVRGLWRRWHTREHYGADSLDSALDATAGDVLVDSIDYESQVCGKIECSRLWGALPTDRPTASNGSTRLDSIRQLVEKRLAGERLSGRAHSRLNEWAAAHSQLFLGSV